MQPLGLRQEEQPEYSSGPQDLQNLPQRISQRKVRRQLSSAEWEELKPVIWRIYIEEWSTLTRMTQILEREHGVLLT